MVVVLGSLEHQVLEEVGEPGRAGALVLRSDVVPEVDGHNRTVVILVQDDVEAVGERVPDIRNLHAVSPSNHQIGR